MGYFTKKEVEVEVAAHRNKRLPLPMISHVLQLGDIDDLDEIDEDCQLAYVFCETHTRYEWHNIPMEWIGKTGKIVRMTKPGWKGAI